MLINLKTWKQALVEHYTIELTARLPERITTPCTLDCQTKLSAYNDYFLLELTVKSQLKITCQRCLQPFIHKYDNHTVLAVCRSEMLAEQLKIDHDCVVANNNQVDLVELLTDELYLYSPESHPNITDCDRDVEKYIRPSVSI